MSIKNDQKRTIKPTHPGEMLREDFMLDYNLTTAKLARVLGVSRQTVYNAINNGDLQSFKVGRRRLVSPHALHDMVSRLEKSAA